MPIYIVKNAHGHARLIDSPNAAQAIRHATRSEFSAKVATPHELVELAGRGVKVEKAGDPEVAPLPPRKGPPPTPSDPIGAPRPDPPANAPHP